MTAIDTTARGIAALLVVALLAACGSGTSASPPAVGDRPFADPQPVHIEGYSGDLMEPFLSPDGDTLFFNDSNAPGNDTNLYYAARIDDLHFQFKGPIANANSTVLDAVASMDASGTFYFVSTRSYFQTLATIYSGHYANGTLGNLTLVQGLSLQQPGALNFDAGISADGKTLYFVDGAFNGGTVPVAADIAMATRVSTGVFQRSPQSASLLQVVNSANLEYAPCISPDGLELFFTRAVGLTTAIYRAHRSAADRPFDEPQVVSAAVGDVVEAPTLSPDGHSLYYHAKVNGVYSLFRVTR